MSRSDIDVTDQDSTLGYREFLPGLVDGGNYTFNVWFDPNDTTHTQGVGTGLLGDFEGDGCTLAAFEVDLNMCSGTAIWTFDAYLNSFSPTQNLEGSLEAEFSVKISGKPTLTVT